MNMMQEKFVPHKIEFIKTAKNIWHIILILIRIVSHYNHTSTLFRQLFLQLYRLSRSSNLASFFFFSTAIGLTNFSTAVEVGPDDGITIQQIDFFIGRGFPAEQADSDWGQVEVNTAILTANTGIPHGYLNIYTDAGWVIQNLIIDPLGPGYPVTYFDLDITPGTPLISLSARIDYSLTPLNQFFDGFRQFFSVESEDFDATGASDEDPEGIGDPPPPKTDPNNPLIGATTKVVLPNLSNLQTAYQQCSTMAVANSLQFLEDSYANISIPNKHDKGIKGDNTLVGQLDSYSGRQADDRIRGKGVKAKPLMEGKFKYLQDNNLTNQFRHSFQGTGLETGTGNFTHAGSTAINRGAKVTWEWICDEIKKGNDVELVYKFSKGKHMVRVFACGITNGKNWLQYAEDSKQTGSKDPNDTKGLITPFAQDIRDMDGDQIINFGSADREIEFAFSEAPVDRKPSTTIKITGSSDIILSTENNNGFAYRSAIYHRWYGTGDTFFNLSTTPVKHDGPVVSKREKGVSNSNTDKNFDPNNSGAYGQTKVKVTSSGGFSNSGAYTDFTYDYVITSSVSTPSVILHPVREKGKIVDPTPLTIGEPGSSLVYTPKIKHGTQIQEADELFTPKTEIMVRFGLGNFSGGDTHPDPEIFWEDPAPAGAFNVFEITIQESTNGDIDAIANLPVSPNPDFSLQFSDTASAIEAAIENANWVKANGIWTLEDNDLPLVDITLLSTNASNTGLDAVIGSFASGDVYAVDNNFFIPAINNSLLIFAFLLTVIVVYSYHSQIDIQHIIKIFSTTKT